MRKNGIKIVSLVVALCLLSGCVSFPILGEEDSERIANYATALLLKYDANYETRLVDTTVIEEERAIQAAIDAEKAAAEQAIIEKNQLAEEELLQENTGENVEAENVDVNIAEVLGVSNVAIEYAYFEMSDAYPAADAQTIIGQILPTDGNHLLLAHFTVTNTTNEEQDVKLINPGVVYRISVNGLSANNCLTTIVPGDFTCFQDTLDSGQMVDLVLIVETEFETVEDVENLVLSIFYNGTTIKTKLGA